MLTELCLSLVRCYVIWFNIFKSGIDGLPLTHQFLRLAILSLQALTVL